MKKIIMPIAAALLALTAVLTSALSKNDTLAPVPVAYDQCSCNLAGTCTNVGTPCAVTCGDLIIPLYERTGTPATCLTQALGTFEN